MSERFRNPAPEAGYLLQEQIPSRQEMMEYYMQEIREALFQYSIFANLDEEQSRAYILLSLAGASRKEPDE